MQQQTITMMTSVSRGGSSDDIDINHPQQHSTGITQLMPIMKQEPLNNQPQQHSTGITQLMPIIKQEPLNHQPQPQQLLYQQQQHQLHQFNNQLQAQSTQQQQQQQPQPPIQNGPKPRGRRKKIRTEPIRPVCPQCEKQFSNQSALTKHKLTHSDERKFACQQCSKAFKRHDHLTGHMQTHSNRKPFNCTIQGCDKTYCDARSLRRHKENIHHIVTQTQEPSHLLRRRIQRLHSDQGAYNRVDVEHHQLNCVTAPPHSMPPQTSLTPQQVTTTTTTTPTPNGNSNSSSSSSISDHQSYLNHHDHAGQHGSYSADYASTQHFSFDFVPVANGNGGGLGADQFANHHHHHHHHHPSSASHHHHYQGVHLDHHAASLDQGLGGTRGVPHSADSFADSGLGLNVHYEQHTPQPLPPPPPPASRLYQNHHQQEQQQQQQQQRQQQPHHQHHQQQHQQPQHHVSYSAGYATTQHFDFEPSHLLRRRIQRLHSDQGAYNRDGEHHQLNCVTAPPHSLPPQASLTPQQANTTTTTTTPTPNGNSNNSSSSSSMGANHQTYLNHHEHAGQHGSYSADYASTQHFSFDFVPVANGNGGIGADHFANHHHHHSTLHHHHQGAHLDHHASSLDQGLDTRGVPHSADSIADSGLGLNVHYEQHTPQPQPPPPPASRLYHHHHQQDQQQPHHHQQPQQQQQHHT